MGDDILQGQCVVWNGYFIGTMIASVVLVAFNMYLSYRRDKSVSRGSVDWGLPWGIGVFLFNISLWNLFPPNVFFILFKAALPEFNDLAPEMACLTVQSYPIITTFLVILGFQIVFLYSPNAIAEKMVKYQADDTDIAPEKSIEESKAPLVLYFGAPSRGRTLCERLLKRAEYIADNTKTFVAKTDVILFANYTQKDRDFLDNNLAIMGVPSREFNVVLTKQVSVENIFKLPYADNSVDKVLWSQFIRNAPPIGSWVTSEAIKAKKMGMCLDEVFRVLKPGGKFISLDSVDRALFTYADCRDAIGAEHVKLEEDVETVRVTPFLPMKMWRVTGTKPQNYVTQTRFTDADFVEDGEQMESRSLLGRDSLNGEPGLSSEEREKLIPSWKIMGVLVTFQVVVFFVLCFTAAALYMPLNIPTDIPLSQRAGNILPGIATSYASFAFFDREIVLNTMVFESLAGVFMWEVRGSLLSVVATLIFTVIIAVPQTLFQIGLAHTGLSDTVRSIIGISISIIIGVVLYKYGSYSRNKKTLKERKLDPDYIKKL